MQHFNLNNEKYCLRKQTIKIYILLVKKVKNI